MHRTAAILALLLAFPLTAQEQFGEKVDVNVVLVDAIVTDATGHQILGLDKDDFVVTEDGQPQKIESIDYFTNRRLLNAREGNIPFKAERVREDRYFVFFFDKPEPGAMFDRLLTRRNPLGLLSEDLAFDDGEAWGNFPQTYSHVGLINAAMRLSRPWQDAT